MVEGSTDFYASRIPKRQRKSNMIDELLSDAEFRRFVQITDLSPVTGYLCIL